MQGIHGAAGGGLNPADPHSWEKGMPPGIERNFSCRRAVRIEGALPKGEFVHSWPPQVGESQLN